MDCGMSYTPSELDELRRLLIRLNQVRGGRLDLKHEELVHVTNQTDLSLLSVAVETERRQFGEKLAKSRAVDIGFEEERHEGAEPCRRDVVLMMRLYAKYLRGCVEYDITPDPAISAASKRWADDGLTVEQLVAKQQRASVNA